MKGIYQATPTALNTLREVTGTVLNGIANLIPESAQSDRMTQVKDEVIRRAILQGHNM